MSTTTATSKPWFSMPLAAVIAIFLWSHVPILAELVEVWSSDPDYSHGFFVAPMAVYLLWQRRANRPKRYEPSWLGAILFVGGLTARAAGLILAITPIEHFSFLLTLAGVVWFVGGTHVFKWSAPCIAYLVFMFRLPHFVAVQWALPLQRLGAECSAFLLRCVGIAALAEGNVIQLEAEKINVAYACSGLQMIVAFLAVTGAIALLSNFSTLGKFVVFVLAIPVAVLCNILRITATGIGYQFFNGASVRQSIHDWGGFLFIPIAIGMVFLAIRIFDFCFPIARRSRHSESASYSRDYRAHKSSG